MKCSTVLVVLVSALLTTAGAAFAVLPKKGGTYVGDIKSAPFAMHINVRVSPTGTTLQHFTYLCGTGRAPTTVFGIPVDRTSHFKYTKTTGTAVVWKMAGRFLSPTKALVSLNSIACGGSKGSTTLTLQ
jgi:hypothetical protein